MEERRGKDTYFRHSILVALIIHKHQLALHRETERDNASKVIAQTECVCTAHSVDLTDLSQRIRVSNQNASV